jgi:hypothetical protein
MFEGYDLIVGLSSDKQRSRIENPCGGGRISPQATKNDANQRLTCRGLHVSALSQSSLPAGVFGMISGGTVSTMLLPLSSSIWLYVPPTGSIYGTDATECGCVGTFQCTGP